MIILKMIQQIEAPRIKVNTGITVSMKINFRIEYLLKVKRIAVKTIL